jgi:hypothetical protein
MTKTFADEPPYCLDHIFGPMFIGGALPDGTSSSHHSPDFAVDDEACRNFSGILAACAVGLAQG